MRLKKRLAFLLVLPLAVSACGNDLESRNSAVGADNFSRDLRLSEPDSADANSNPRVIDGSGARPSTTDQEDEENETLGFAADEPDEADETDIIDARPEDLIISTDGVAPEPMDDAQGFAPEPTAPEPFAPNPVPQEQPQQ